MDKQSLQALLAKVEAGTAVGVDFLPFEPDHHAKAANAYNGSLDAAKALHDAVLPGRDMVLEIMADGVGYVRIWDGCELSEGDNFPARAWLIAIIRALIQEALASVLRGHGEVEK
ncbi:MAG: hypothetical protein ACOH2M_28245 [Cypionkella sp.]